VVESVVLALIRDLCVVVPLLLSQSESLEAIRGLHALVEVLLQLRHSHSVMWPLRTRHTWLNSG